MANDAQKGLTNGRRLDYTQQDQMKSQIFQSTENLSDDLLIKSFGGQKQLRNPRINRSQDRQLETND